MNRSDIFYLLKKYTIKYDQVLVALIFDHSFDHSYNDRSFMNAQLYKMCWTKKTVKFGLAQKKEHETCSINFHEFRLILHQKEVYLKLS